MGMLVVLQGGKTVSKNNSPALRRSCNRALNEAANGNNIEVYAVFKILKAVSWREKTIKNGAVGRSNGQHGRKGTLMAVAGWTMHATGEPTVASDRRWPEA